MKPAFLFGPFVGSLSYELYRFAPYAINLKFNNPDNALLIYTRPERFDLYGSYADILIPLRIKNDGKDIQNNYNLNGLDKNNYDQMIKIFERKYKSHYKIRKHFYPNFVNYVDWQFPKNEMNYNFDPRIENINLMEKLMGKCDHILVDLSGLYLDEAFYFIEKLDREIDKKIRFIIYNPSNSYSKLLFTSRKIIELDKIKYDMSISLLGCLITSIKKSLFTISINFSEASHLSLLLKTKLHMYREFSEDFVKKINPYNTPIYLFDSVKEENFEL